MTLPIVMTVIEPMDNIRMFSIVAATMILVPSSPLWPIHDSSMSETLPVMRDIIPRPIVTMTNMASIMPAIVITLDAYLQIFFNLDRPCFIRPSIHSV